MTLLKGATMRRMLSVLMLFGLTVTAIAQAPQPPQRGEGKMWRYEGDHLVSYTYGQQRWDVPYLRLSGGVTMTIDGGSTLAADQAAIVLQSGEVELTGSVRLLLGLAVTRVAQSQPAPSSAGRAASAEGKMWLSSNRVVDFTYGQQKWEGQDLRLSGGVTLTLAEGPILSADQMAMELNTGKVQLAGNVLLTLK
jgi:hypothetical protein